MAPRRLVWFIHVYSYCYIGFRICYWNIQGWIHTVPPFCIVTSDKSCHSGVSIKFSHWQIKRNRISDLSAVWRKLTFLRNKKFSLILFVFARKKRRGNFQGGGNGQRANGRVESMHSFGWERKEDGRKERIWYSSPGGRRRNGTVSRKGIFSIVIDDGFNGIAKFTTRDVWLNNTISSEALSLSLSSSITIMEFFWEQLPCLLPSLPLTLRFNLQFSKQEFYFDFQCNVF